MKLATWNRLNLYRLKRPKRLIYDEINSSVGRALDVFLEVIGSSPILDYQLYHFNIRDNFKPIQYKYEKDSLSPCRRSRRRGPRLWRLQARHPQQRQEAGRRPG